MLDSTNKPGIVCLGIPAWSASRLLFASTLVHTLKDTWRCFSEVARLDRKRLGARSRGEVQASSQSVFDKETRRKALAVAADAGYGKAMPLCSDSAYYFAKGEAKVTGHSETCTVPSAEENRTNDFR